MQKIWLEHYPYGVPHEINPDKYASIPDLFEKKIAQYGNRTAYINHGTHITYKEVEEHSRHFANYLLQNLQLEKGDRVGVMLPNILQFPIVFFGILRAGLIVVNINPLYTPAELRPILEDSNIATIVVLAQFASTIEKVLPFTALKNVIITEITDLFPPLKRMVTSFVLKHILHKTPVHRLSHPIYFLDALAFGKTVLFTPGPIARDDIAILQYTGGTTGLPKGVMLTHRNLLANIIQGLAWISPLLSSDPPETFVTPLPLYHIFSMTANALIPLCLGAVNILITNPKDIKQFIEEIAHQPFTVITGVNTLYKTLLNSPQFLKNVSFAHLKLALAGGMSLQKDIASLWQKTTGKPLLEAYGLSEASPGISMMPVNLEQRREGSVGLPWPSTEVDIRSDTGISLNINEEGEIWVKGPQVMQGYWNNLQATRSVLIDDWLDTGDIGKIDADGFLSIVDRKKDMIIVSGFNIYPSEVEAVLLKHPDIQEAAVVGVLDKDGLEIVKACIVLRRPKLNRQDVIAYCKTYLSAYKIPRIIEFRDSLPKSAVGKVLKRELR